MPKIFYIMRNVLNGSMMVSHSKNECALSTQKNCGNRLQAIELSNN